jgi:hypothetical protein
MISISSGAVLLHRLRGGAATESKEKVKHKYRLVNQPDSFSALPVRGWNCMQIQEFSAELEDWNKQTAKTGRIASFRVRLTAIPCAKVSAYREQPDFVPGSG